MPELPEVETVCRGLTRAIKGLTIQTVAVHRPNLRFDFPIDMAQRLTGRIIQSISRRSKYILITLDNGLVWMIHLGMSGRVTFPKSNEPRAKHDHVVVTFTDGTIMAYNDPRRFGLMDLSDTDQINDHRLMKTIGMDPFDDRLTAHWLIDRLSGKKTTIKNVLMDQRIIAGLGNIYVCEALFRTQIHPETSAGNIDVTLLTALITHIRAVLTQAIDAGGSSLRDYVQTDGTLGYFQSAFQVYGREGDPCMTCGDAIQRMVQSGRSTFYCPTCQKTV